MKTKLPLIAALYCGLCTAGSAFTLDFVGYEGILLPPNPLVIPIAGYGNVAFEAVAPSALVVDNSFENDDPARSTSPSLSFDMGDKAKITFLGPTPLNVDFDYVGNNVGEYFETAQGANSKEFFVTLKGNGNGAGLYQVSFNAVPEPSASLLGAIGCCLLVLRRRR